LQLKKKEQRKGKERGGGKAPKKGGLDSTHPSSSIEKASKERERGCGEPISFTEVIYEPEAERSSRRPVCPW